MKRPGPPARLSPRPATRRSRWADLKLDLMKRMVDAPGGEAHRTPNRRNSGCLEFLVASTPNRVVTRTMLLEAVWDFHFDPKTNIVETHIRPAARQASNRGRGRDAELIPHGPRPWLTLLRAPDALTSFAPQPSGSPRLYGRAVRAVLPALILGAGGLLGGPLRPSSRQTDAKLEAEIGYPRQRGSQRAGRDPPDRAGDQARAAAGRERPRLSPAKTPTARNPGGRNAQTMRLLHPGWTTIDVPHAGAERTAGRPRARCGRWLQRRRTRRRSPARGRRRNVDRIRGRRGGDSPRRSFGP